MERCYVKDKLYLQDAIQEIAKEEGWAIGKMAAFAVATKDGLFSVLISIKENKIEINKINLSETHVVTYNIIHNEDGSIESYIDSIDREIFEGFKNGTLKNEKLEISLMLDYKNN